jgi:hypothetical protein
MYLINKSLTGVKELDTSLQRYFGYLTDINVLPDGDYVLAGGSIRAILDKTGARDLDIYILGDMAHHHEVLDAVIDVSLDVMSLTKFCNPFAHFRMLNITVEYAQYLTRDSKRRKQQNFGMGVAVPTHAQPMPISSAEANNDDKEQELGIDWSDGFTAPIQLISFCYDSKYYERTPSTIGKDERFSDTYVSTMSEVVNSFDMNLSKGGVHFTVSGNNLIVNSVNIPHDTIIDICMKQMRLSSPDGVVPQQLCGMSRFHKFVKLGYDVDPDFHKVWRERFEFNPHVLGLSYD